LESVGERAATRRQQRTQSDGGLRFVCRPSVRRAMHGRRRYNRRTKAEINSPAALTLRRVRSRADRRTDGRTDKRMARGGEKRSSGDKFCATHNAEPSSDVARVVQAKRTNDYFSTSITCRYSHITAAAVASLMSFRVHTSCAVQ